MKSFEKLILVLQFAVETSKALPERSGENK